MKRLLEFIITFVASGILILIWFLVWCANA